MPEITSVKKYKLEIKSILKDSLNEELTKVYDQLIEADSSMMQWMINHHEQHFNYTAEKNKAILDTLMTEIVIVKDRINNSLRAARELFKVE